MYTCVSHVLSIKTKARSLINVTSEVARVVDDWVSEFHIDSGLCTLFLSHTSASLIIQENADPNVLKDLETYLSKIVPEGSHYRHQEEGPDDMPAHIRTVLTHTSQSIPIVAGKLALGIWQGLYVWEHRNQPHERNLALHLGGNSRANR